jgi:hypothetical protein
MRIASLHLSLVEEEVLRDHVAHCVEQAIVSGDATGSMTEDSRAYRPPEPHSALIQINGHPINPCKELHMTIQVELFTRRATLGLIASAGISLASGVHAQTLPPIQVWKDPNCGSCSGWVVHLRLGCEEAAKTQSYKGYRP